MKCSSIQIILIFILASFTTACKKEQPVSPPETADEWAFFAAKATGGEETWRSVPFLGFTFAIETDGEIVSDRKHMWNRKTGEYRLEWEGGTDSVYVVLYNVRTREGTAFLNGVPVEGGSERMVSSAYTRFINDTYWLMMPAKMMDRGVSRSLVADSSNAESVVINLSFDSVGLTPGDQYWVRIDRKTGDVLSWSYILESNTSGVATSYLWDAYRAYETPVGTIRLPEAKSRRDANRRIITSDVTFPETVDTSLFTDGTPLLYASE